MPKTPSHKKKSRNAAIVTPTLQLKLWHHDHSMTPDVRVEIVPLIDVIFCILTFFILAAVHLSRQQAISLNLPKASTGTPQMREMLVVSLDDFSQVYVEQQPVTRNQLYDSLKNYHQFNPNGLMVLHASRNASYNEVVQVLDLLRQVGGDRVALATLPGEVESPDNFNTYPGANPLPASPNYSNPNGSYNPSPPNLPSNPNPGLGNSQINPSNPSIPSVPTAPTAPNTSPKIQKHPALQNE